MAFATNQDFFSFVDNHRVFLLNCLPKEHESMMEEASRNATSQFQDTITSSQVLRAIESVIQDIVSSLSRNEPPFFTLNNRSSWGNIEFNESVGLQMISHCTTKKVRSDCPKSAQRFALILKILSMIYKLVQSNMYATKRDIYYTNVQLFGSQHIVDTIIDDISCLLKIPRRSLHILSTSKGCIAGDLCYTEDGTKVNCAGNAMSVLVPSNIQGITNMTSNAKFILIVEKDATFQRLLSDDFCNKVSPCIMITGKGVPDLNTRLLVRKLWDTFHIPIFTLVDADPYVNGHNPFVWTGLVGPKERKLSGKTFFLMLLLYYSNCTHNCQYRICT
uniref:DNA topoisomerase (ATP-hydrolyzing) n=1 Tax=Geotrypetes seraphini TaxID=260995 RepID=A0A6P8SJG8_GEOSA|nr:meiotic recombination protein SPO11 isoform X3 [Geotrypetes seraphini]